MDVRFSTSTVVATCDDVFSPDEHLALAGFLACYSGLTRDAYTLGRARATIARRLCIVSCFYRYAEEEGLIAVSPAAHVRRPRLDYESHATGLDRNEVGVMLVAAGLAKARDRPLIANADLFR